MMGTLAGGTKSLYAPGSAAKQSPARLALGFGFSLVALAVAACGGGQSMTPTATTTAIVTPAQASGGTPPASRKPNIILILTDDQRADEFANLMPKTKKLVTDAGAVVPNFFVTTPLGDPSRVSYLVGEYAHNHGIQLDGPPASGFEGLYKSGLEASTLAVALQQAGYRTGLFGKYMTGYRPGALKALGLSDAYTPPGWDTWVGSVAGQASKGFNYQLIENGSVVQYGKAATDYATDVFAARAASFVKASAAAGKPFLAYITPDAPQFPSTPAPRHASEFATITAPRSPAFNEPDVSDKPTYVRNLPPLTAKQIADLDTFYPRRAQSVAGIDDLVEQVVNAVDAAGQLGNTYIFVTSDNGRLEGEHRFAGGKAAPYEPGLRVSMLVRGPGIPAGRVIDGLAANIDLAPTFAEIAGTKLPGSPDGRSLLPLLTGTAPWRSAVLFEQWPTNLGTPRFETVRMADASYTEYATGERELYDLKADPDQLQNLVSRTSPATLDALSAYLARLKTCKAAICHTIEDEQPPTIRP